jgi:hypothetical protein
MGHLGPHIVEIRELIRPAWNIEKGREFDAPIYGVLKDLILDVRL